MVTITWKETPPTWTALLDDQPVCTLKRKDIGGWTATWAGERLWPAPVHLPKAIPQPSQFFMNLDDAKDAVVAVLGA